MQHIHSFTIQVILMLKYDAIHYVLIPLPINTSHVKCKLSSQLTRNYNSYNHLATSQLNTILLLHE